MNVLERGALSSTYQDYDLKNTSTLDERALVSLDWRQSNDMDTMPALETNDDSFLDPQSFIESYTIAWICALQEEFQAACQMLDVDDFETPKGMEASTNDRNVYVFGQLGSHYVVVGCLPKGRTGTINAANVANDMIRTFPNLKFALMVGIGGGAPTKKKDIRLGDVVVSAPSGDHGGVVQLDFGTRLSNGIFKRKGHLNSPPNALLTTTQNVQRLLDNLAKPDMLAEHIKRMNHMPDYSRPQRDRLYRAKFLHRDVDHAQTNTNNLDDDNEDYSNDEDEDGCRYCGEVELVRRKDRKSSREVTVHYGTIASDNVVMRDAEARNKHAMDKDLNVLCFETEAAGLMNNLQCLVIRGICDYADSHKNDEWHKYAALVAAAYARELLLLLKPDRVACMPAWTETKQLNKQIHEIKQNQQNLGRQAMIENQKAEDFRINQKLVALRDRILLLDSSSQDTYEKAYKDHHKETCKWLFRRDEFKNWIADDSSTPVLWINGKHGAGKTVLCAAAIKHMSSNASSPPCEAEGKTLPLSMSSPVIIRQFLSKDDHISRRHLLRITATQLMDYLISMAGDTIPESIIRFLNVTNDDSSKLEDLIRAILQELPLTYIFVDGLDEAEYAIIPKSTLTFRPPEDVQLFIEFLIQETAQSSDKVRLWLTSQPLPSIRQYVCNPENPEWCGRIGQIQLTTDDTQSDIESYLSHYIPISTKNKSSLAKFIVSKSLKTEVEGSFLWASAMVNEFQDETEDDDDVMALAEKSLPVKMSKVYEKVLNKIVDNDKKPKSPPLWKVVLSLLTFAKRPLKMSEAIESIAILRTSTGHDLRTDQVSDEKILKCCLSLVRHAPKISDGRNVGLLRLSHSAVRTFLLEDAGTILTAGTEHKHAVESWIIRDSCLKYLSQPRYRELLVKRSSALFKTQDGDNVLSHQFLLYAAKYWFRHFDLPHESKDAALDEGDRATVTKFLRSPNFVTIMQVQSLFIAGYFLQSFDPITDRGVSVRRTLPNWVQQHEPDLHRQYQAFQGQWCRILQSSLFESFRGEIDRCFWGALGPESFLSSQTHRKARYNSFEFSKGSKSEYDSCQVHHVSQDGQRLVTGWIRTEGKQNQLYLEAWAIDGKSRPRAKMTTTMSFSATDTNIALYRLPCSQSFNSIPLIPRVESVVPPDAIAVRLDGSIIRLGSKMFKVLSADSLSQEPKFCELTGKCIGDSWEEVCIREPFLVVCRRRVYRERLQATEDEREAQRVQKLRRRMSDHERSRSRARSSGALPPFLDPTSLSPKIRRRIRYRNSETGLSFQFKFGSGDSDDQSSEYSSDFASDSNSSNESIDLPSAAESWSEGSSSVDDPASEGIDDQDSEESNDDDIGDVNSEIKSQSSEDDNESDIKSTLSIQSGHSQESNTFGSADSIISQILGDSPSSSEEGDIESDISEDEILRAEPAAANPEPEGPVVIGKPNSRVSCDFCNRNRFRTWYHCIICNDNNFDLCDHCERKGVWCLDLRHQLYKIVNRKPSGVVFRRNFNVRQELTVYRTDVPDEKRALFHYRKKYPTMLYESPPVIHQIHPLVIWALSDSRLLFADLANNKFFEQKISGAPGSKKARPICASLSFSPCGRFLRMAIVDIIAEKTQPKRGVIGFIATAPKSCLCLNLHVLILQLSSSQPARNRPKLLASTTCRLGVSCARAFVPTLPFAFTWGASDLYLTLSDSLLCVYRIILPVIELQKPATENADHVEKKEANFTIVIPKEKILLPRSSRNRSVQFFPATAPSTNATVIIGPRYGQNSTPPIGVYLRAEDIGGWEDLERMGDGEGNIYSSQKSLGDQFEEPWDENQDCILIPFEGY